MVPASKRSGRKQGGSVLATGAPVIAVTRPIVDARRALP